MVIDNVEGFIPLVAFLGQVLGQDSEIVLQKTAGEGQGILAIAGKPLSGRNVGDPVSKAVALLRDTGAYRDRDSLDRLTDKADSHTPLRTSTLFLTDEAGALLGTLHINTDMTDYVQLGRRLLAYAGVQPSEEPAQTPYAKAAEAAGSTGVPALDETLYAMGLASLPPKRLTDAERQQLVGLMDAKGAFDRKGSIPETAAALGIAESTVYRYIKLEKRG